MTILIILSDPIAFAFSKYDGTKDVCPIAPTRPVRIIPSLSTALSSKSYFREQYLQDIKGSAAITSELLRYGYPKSGVV